MLAPLLAAAAIGLPPDWIPVSRGPAGGVVWQGRIPNTFAADARPSAVYLPPGYTNEGRYPVIYLLHGLPGAPSSFWDALRLADVADGLIVAGRAPPFVAVMPVGGPVADPEDGEWTGPWESFVVDDVVPWVDAHLATIPDASGRALAGLSAGGYGAVDIGLRHPGLFGTLESWGGYFGPVLRDAPFEAFSSAQRRAHDATLLVRSEAARLRAAHVRFFLSTGSGHGAVLRRWTIDFAREVASLRLAHDLWILPPSERDHFWRATFEPALLYAAAGFAA